jgi:RNA recognition motif-containing protein
MPVHDDAIQNSSSIPIQLVGGVFNTPNAKITEDQKQYFESILLKGSYNDYNPVLSDDLKFNIRVENVPEFLAETVNLCGANFKACLKSYYHHTRGFWQFNFSEEYDLSPGSYHNSLFQSPRYLTRDNSSSRGSFYLMVRRYSDEDTTADLFQDLSDDEAAAKIYSTYVIQGKPINISEDKFVRIISPLIRANKPTQFLKDRLATSDTIFNQTMQQPALYFWLAIFSFAVIFCANRNRRLLWAFMPIIMLFIVNFGFAPIAYFRYVMPIAFVMPFVLVIALNELYNRLPGRKFVKN